MLPDRVRRLFRVRFTGDHLAREIDEELADHVERRAEALMQSGMPREDAYIEARRRFGDARGVRDECLQEDHGELRRSTMRIWLDHLRGDLRFALRSLKRAPAYAAIALITLSVGIGSVTAIISAVYGWSLRPLPYKNAERMIVIEERRPTGGYYSRAVSLDAARQILSGSRSFERVTIFERNYVRPSDDPNTGWETLHIDSAFVPIFGLQPQRGRVMTSDEIRDQAPVAMISDQLWHTTFGGDSTVVGRTVRMNDELVTVVGILPPGFRYPMRTDVWRPTRQVDSADQRVTLLALMKPGVTKAGVATEMAVISQRLVQLDRQLFASVNLAIVDIVERQVNGPIISLMALFVGASIFVLLIACSNVANLLLVRAAERRGEMAVRSSLGAGRARLITQALLEAVVLSTVAGLIGTVLSRGIVKVALSMIPTVGLPSWMSFDIDGRILLVTIGIVALVTLAVGLVPAREATRFDLVRALKAGGDGGIVNSGVVRSARRTIVLQLALSVALFVGGALLVQTYRRLQTVDVGYPADKIILLNAFFAAEQYPGDTARLRFVEEITNRLRAAAGVQSAAVRGIANRQTLSRSGGAITTARGRQAQAQADLRLFIDNDTARDRRPDIERQSRYFAVGDDYFRTLGLRIQRGRGLTVDDRPGSQIVAVVSRRYADVIWGSENPIGRFMQFGMNGSRIVVVGVVDDVRDLLSGVRGVTADPRADVYFSSRQVPAFQIAALARGTSDIAGLQRAAQTIARRVDPDVSTRVVTMEDNVDTQRMVTRWFGSLIGGFAVCGLLLSIIGIYGVVAYGITQRTRELGIRIALGGTSQDVLRLVMNGALKFVGIGLVIGLGLALATTRLLRIVLFGVSPTDPMTFGAACVLFGGVALLACYVPARRVTKIDPLKALRTE
jgi:predicted permease